jgi:hypothetical protein
MAVEALPFEQQSGETAKAYAAFCTYRDMGPERSVRDVAQRLHKSVTVIGRWSSHYNWPERARSYDAAIDARARAATEQDAIERRRRMLAEHADEARTLRQVARRLTDEFERRYGEKGTLQWIGGEDFIKMVAQLPRIVETAQKLERLAAGEATDRHEHTLTVEQVLRMPEEEFDALVKDLGIES